MATLTQRSWDSAEDIINPPKPRGAGVAVLTSLRRRFQPDGGDLKA